jgi:isoquinoline 1-oxidoreductase subunit alpha
MKSFRFIINRVPIIAKAPPNQPLIWLLRDHLRLTGTKFGCGVGRCGACAVLVEGKAVRSCVVPVSAVAEKNITTIEGVAQSGFQKIPEAWLVEGVSQCGYCQPGQIISACALLGQNPKPTDGDIDEAMAGNLCRCGTYLRIRRAIHRASIETERSNRPAQ